MDSLSHCFVSLSRLVPGLEADLHGWLVDRPASHPALLADCHASRGSLRLEATWWSVESLEMVRDSQKSRRKNMNSLYKVQGVVAVVLGGEGEEPQNPMVIIMFPMF